MGFWDLFQHSTWRQIWFCYITFASHKPIRISDDQDNSVVMWGMDNSLEHADNHQQIIDRWGNVSNNIIYVNKVHK